VRDRQRHALRSEFVQTRRGNLAAFRIQAMHVAIAQVVCKDADDVRFIGGVQRKPWREPNGGQEWDGFFQRVFDANFLFV
jgi:hypothetical protein